METRTGPLAGVRVLEFSLIVSAPIAGLNLSDFGADVIKVEPPGGEPGRHISAAVPGHGKVFQACNRGKRSLVIDLHKPGGKEIIHRITPAIDVVLLNYRPGIAERLGLGYETLSKIRPDLIYAEITGFGSTGPLADRPASDMVAQAYGGSVAANGKLGPDGSPVYPTLPIADAPSGLSAAMGIIAALYHRERTGEGQYLAVSLLRTVMAMTNYTVMVEPVNDAFSRDIVKRELASAREAGASYDSLVGIREGTAGQGSGFSLYFGGYRAKDGGIVLGALTPANRNAIRGVLGIDDDPYDTPGFDPTADASKALMEDLRARIRTLFLTRPVSEWVRLLEEAGAPAAPVNFPEDLPDDPQASLHYSDLVHPVTGPQRQVSPAVEMSKSPTRAAGPSPSIGQHTQEILTELGEFSPDEILALEHAGVISSDGARDSSGS
jgi:crotonobetainyl-CoA:carnitine CoA-transferase CaiB-like acyl-CoA transferase